MSAAIVIKQHIVSEYAPDTSADELPSSYDLLDTGLVDSLALLGLITWVGERFGIAVDEVEISPEDFRSVDAILRFIEITKSA